MIRPVDAPVSQAFGENPTKHLSWDSWLIQTFGNYQPDGHSGQDYACDVGAPIKAVTSGTVRHIGWMSGSYAENPWWIMPLFAGYVVVIDHGAFIGIYGHCKDGSGRVAKGQRVNEGQVIALSGNTGASTGPHLHFEILPDQYVLNSAMYGRINPETLFAGTVTPHSAPTQIKDWFDMATEDQLRKVIREENPWGYKNPALEKDDAYALLRATRTYVVKNNAELAAVKSIVSQLAAKQGVEIDYGKIDAIVAQRIKEADLLKVGDVVSVDVNVQGK